MMMIDSVRERLGYLSAINNDIGSSISILSFPASVDVLVVGHGRSLSLSKLRRNRSRVPISPYHSCMRNLFIY